MSLYEKLRHWQNRRGRTAGFYLALGLAGLVVPVIPGMLFLGFAFWLLFPNRAEKIAQQLRQKFGS